MKLLGLLRFKCFRTGYARITHGGLSDTEVQVGRFEIPDNPDYEDNVRTTTDPDDVPEHIRFSKT